MTPAQFDLLIRRLLAIQAPKETRSSKVSKEQLLKKNKRANIYSSNLCILWSPKDFVYLLLLIRWLSVVDLEGTQWDLMDFFCGAGRIGALAAAVKFRVAAYDILIPPKPSRKRKKYEYYSHQRSPMDINGESGFVFLGKIKASQGVLIFVKRACVTLNANKYMISSSYYGMLLFGCK